MNSARNLQRCNETKKRSILIIQRLLIRKRPHFRTGFNIHWQTITNIAATNSLPITIAHSIMTPSRNLHEESKDGRGELI